MANISRTADPIFNFFFFKCAEFNLESALLGQIFDISHGFSGKLEKLIFRPGNHEIGNTAKFWRDWKKRIPDSDSATQNCMETSGFVSGQKVELILLTCVFILSRASKKNDKTNIKLISVLYERLIYSFQIKKKSYQKI